MRWRGTDTGTDTEADGEFRAAADASPAAGPAAVTVTLMEREFARAVRTTRLDTRPRSAREDAPNGAPETHGIRRPALADPVGPSPDAGVNGRSAAFVAPAPDPSAPGVVDRMRHWVSERNHVIVVAGLVVVTSLATALVISEGVRQLTTPGRDTTPYLVTGPRGPVRLPTVESPPGHGPGGTGAQPNRDRTVRRQPGDPRPAADRGPRDNGDMDPIRRHPIADRPLPPGRSPESGRTPPRDNSRDTRCRGRGPDIARCPSQAPRRPSHALLDPADDATGNLIHTGRDTGGRSTGRDAPADTRGDTGGDTGPAGTGTSETAPLNVTGLPVTSLGLLPVAG